MTERDRATNQGNEYEFPSPLSLRMLIESHTESSEVSFRLRTAVDYFMAAATVLDADSLWVNEDDGNLARFEDVFLATHSIISGLDDVLAARAQAIDAELALSQNVIRLSMMVGRRLGVPYSSSILRAIAASLPFPTVRLEFPERGAVRISHEVMADIKTALVRLAGVTRAAMRVADRIDRDRAELIGSGQFFDPERVVRSYVVEYLDRARTALERVTDVPPEAKASLLTAIEGVIAELQRPKPAWAGVLSRLGQIALVTAALVTIGAQVDDVHENVSAAINYIGQSATVVRPSGAQTLAPVESTEEVRLLPSRSSNLNEADAASPGNTEESGDDAPGTD